MNLYFFNELYQKILTILTCKLFQGLTIEEKGSDQGKGEVRQSVSTKQTTMSSKTTVKAKGGEPEVQRKFESKMEQTSSFRSKAVS